jgi:hypothetical protein
MTTGGGTTRFNPNLYANGKVCLSLLGTWRGQSTENWDPKISTLLQVLISIQSIIMSDLVYYNEPSCESEMGTPSGEAKNEAYSNIVRYANIKFAMIRTGFRGYGSGKMVADEEFENNVKGALENNIDVGVYFFSQATSKDEMQEEIDFVLETIAPYKINCPVVIDIEKVDDSSARGNTISKEERTEYVKLFCDQVKEKGYTPMIYGNTYSLFAMLNMDELAEYDVWYAFYSSYIYYPYKVRMWQYSEKFEVPGIDGKVDMNVIIPN